MLLSPNKYVCDSLNLVCGFLSSVEHKIYFVKCHEKEVFYFLSIQWKSMVSKVIWLPTFLKNVFLYVQQKKCILVTKQFCVLVTLDLNCMDEKQRDISQNILFYVPRRKKNLQGWNNKRASK